jgi:hypothetical protein
VSNNDAPEFHTVVRNDLSLGYPPQYGWVIECHTGVRWEYADRFGKDEERARAQLARCLAEYPGEFRLINAKEERPNEVIENCGNCEWRKPYGRGKVFCRLNPPSVGSGYPLVPEFHKCGEYVKGDITK